MKASVVCAGVLLLSFASEAVGAGAEEILPACKSVMSTPHNAAEAQKQGFCLGAVGGIGRVGPGICPPRGSTLEQWIHAVVLYIESLPARQREDFFSLTAEALRAAWPGQNSPAQGALPPR
jgi:Rap1a immunity proteins